MGTPSPFHATPLSSGVGNDCYEDCGAACCCHTLSSFLLHTLWRRSRVWWSHRRCSAAPVEVCPAGATGALHDVSGTPGGWGCRHRWEGLVAAGCRAGWMLSGGGPRTAGTGQCAAGHRRPWAALTAPSPFLVSWRRPHARGQCGPTHYRSRALRRGRWVCGGVGPNGTLPPPLMAWPPEFSAAGSEGEENARLVRRSKAQHPTNHATQDHVTP